MRDSGSASESGTTVVPSPAVIHWITGRETPRRWTLHVQPLGAGNGGWTEFRSRRIGIPAFAFGYRTLWVFFHEAAHAIRFDTEGIEVPSLAEEAVAEVWAARSMRRWGFAVAAGAAASAERNFAQHRN